MPLSSLQIRAANLNDLAGLFALYHELRPHDPIMTTAEAERVLITVLKSGQQTILVGETNNLLVTTCMLAIIPHFACAGKPLGLIEHVVTLSAFRRQGYSRQIIEQALQLAWTRHCCKVMLLSGTQRGEAHKLYESLGFAGDRERGFVIKAPNAC